MFIRKARHRWRRCCDDDQDLVTPTGLTVGFLQNTYRDLVASVITGAAPDMSR